MTNKHICTVCGKPCQKSESPVTPKLSDCKYCYGKGYYTVARGGNTSMGDFLSDAPYTEPLTIKKLPCKKCQKSESPAYNQMFEKTFQRTTATTENTYLGQDPSVEGVSENKPSTGEDWEDSFPFNTFSGETKKQIIEAVKVLLQKQANDVGEIERERACEIVQNHQLSCKDICAPCGNAMEEICSNEIKFNIRNPSHLKIQTY